MKKNKKTDEENNDNQMGGSKRKRISGEALKTKLKSGEIPNI